MEQAPLRDLSDVAWFERTMPAGVGALHLDDNHLLAGDWDGHISCWNLEGKEIWNAETSNRVSGFARGGEYVYAICGRDLVCLNSIDGTINWSAELEGSSDLVACTPDGKHVIATSSVFDIEVNDFMESTIWRFDENGEILQQDEINERPWSVEMRGDGVAHLALGRPRCGMIRSDSEGLHWFPLPSDAPATCGLVGRANTVIGHADGSLTCIEGGMVLDEGPFAKQPGSIESLGSTPNGLIVASTIESGTAGAGFGGAEGLARAYDLDGHLRWQMETPQGRSVEHVIDGPNLCGTPSVWILSWDLTSAIVEIRSEMEGTPEARFEASFRANVCTANSEHLTIGFDDGTLYLIQGDLLARRLESTSDPTESHDNRRVMAAKLRALRG